MTSTDIIFRMYSLGELSVEETNEALKEIGSPLSLNPDKRKITPENCHYTGMLNSGWGYDPCVIENMELKYDDMGDAPATCFYMGKKYKVEGKKLVALV